jgi:hypothetical protein
LLDEAAKAVGIEGNRIVQVGQTVAEANVPGIGGDGNEHRIPLPSQRPENSSLSSIELGQVSRPLEVEKASIQVEDPDRSKDKIFRPIRVKRRLLRQPTGPA